MRLTRAKTTLGRKRRPEAAPEETVIEIRDEFITLAQLLKMAGIIGTGGEAKVYLAAMPVTVNGEPEQRRGKKLRPGDVITLEDSAPIRLVAADGSGPDARPGREEE